MELTVLFSFREKEYLCSAFIDHASFPCFIFIFLHDRELIREFGDDLAIKTDMESCLPRRDDFAELVALRQAIFTAMKDMDAFRTARLIFQRRQHHHQG